MHIVILDDGMKLMTYMVVICSFKFSPFPVFIDAGPNIPNIPGMGHNTKVTRRSMQSEQKFHNCSFIYKSKSEGQ